MKNNIHKFIYLIILIVISYQILMHSSIVFMSINYALSIWKESLIPSMFTFFILSDILINYGFVELIGYLFHKPFKYLFHINNNSIFIIIMSMLSGFPSSAKYIRQLYNENKISLENANKLILYTHFSNPLFLLNVVSINVLNNKKVGLYVLISHYITNFILAFLFRPKNIPNENNELKINIKEKNIVKVITNAINNSIDILLLVLGIIAICSVLSSLVSIHFNHNISFIFNLIFEMTKSLYIIKDLSISLYYKGLLCTVIISFGGICIHMQIMSILSDIKIRYGQYFKARILHSLISGIIYILLFMMHL